MFAFVLGHGEGRAFGVLKQALCILVHEDGIRVPVNSKQFWIWRLDDPSSVSSIGNVSAGAHTCIHASEQTSMHAGSCRHACTHASVSACR